MRDHKKVPQIKIKNSQLANSGFEIGNEYSVVYQPGKITLVLVAEEGNNHKFHFKMSLNLTNHINQSIKLSMCWLKDGTQSVLFGTMTVGF